MTFIMLILPIVFDIASLSSIIIYYNVNKNKLTERYFGVLKTITIMIAIILDFPYIIFCPDVKYVSLSIIFLLIHSLAYSLIIVFLKCRLDDLKYENQQIINKLIGNNKGE